MPPAPAAPPWSCTAAVPTAATCRGRRHSMPCISPPRWIQTVNLTSSATSIITNGNAHRARRPGWALVNIRSNFLRLYKQAQQQQFWVHPDGSLQVGGWVAQDYPRIPTLAMHGTPFSRGWYPMGPSHETDNPVSRVRQPANNNRRNVGRLLPRPWVPAPHPYSANVVEFTVTGWHEHNLARYRIIMTRPPRRSFLNKSPDPSPRPWKPALTPRNSTEYRLLSAPWRTSLDERHVTTRSLPFAPPGDTNKTSGVAGGE